MSAATGGRRARFIFGFTLCLLILASPAIAQTDADSSAFGERVDLDFLPLIGSPVVIASGPQPSVADSAPPAYDHSQTVEGTQVSSPALGSILGTGEMTVTASSLVSSADQVDASSTVDNAMMSIVGNLPLVTLTADEITSTAEIIGTCHSGLDFNADSVLMNATLGGTLGGGVPINPNPPPNTVVFNQAGIRIVLNEQTISGSDTGGSVTVNAVHVFIDNTLLNLLGVLDGEIILGHSEASLSCGAAPSQADLELSGTDAPDPVAVGGLLTYQLQVFNRGPNAAQQVVLSDLLPSSAELVSAVPEQGSCSTGAQLSCALGTLAVGATTGVAIQLRPTVAGTLVNSAGVVADTADSDPSDNQLTLTTVVTGGGGGPPDGADLEITITDTPDPASIGETVTYRVTVRNHGPAVAHDAHILLTPATGVTVLDSDSSVGSCTGVDPVHCELGDMAADGVAIITVEWSSPHAGTLVGVGVVASNDSDPQPQSNQATAVTTVRVPAGPSTAACLIGVSPSATLLIPYFAVDLEAPSGLTTLFAVTNALPEAQLARVTLWTDWAIPTISFDLYLTGYDVQTLNVRDLLAGHLPATGTQISPLGDLSSGHGSFPGCSGQVHNGTLGPNLVAHYRAWHTGRRSPRSNDCAGSPRADDHVAVGYITVDTVNRCSQLDPADPGYFSAGGNGVASNTNALWGEMYMVNPADDFAQGEMAVHLQAHEVLYGQGKTFYGRLVGGTAADNRQPLGSHYATRYAVGGIFDGGTTLVVWRDPARPATSPRACGSSPSWAPLDSGGALVFDEEENGEFVPSSRMRAPLATQRIQVGGPDCPVAHEFGWMSLDLDHTRGLGVLGERTQAWVMTLATAENRFSLAHRALSLDLSCQR